MEETEAIVRRQYRSYVNLQRQQDIELAEILAGAARDAEAIIKRYDGGKLIGKKIRRAQYIEALAEIRREQVRIWSKIDKSIERGIERAADLVFDSWDDVAVFLANVARREGIADAGELSESFELAARRAMRAVRQRIVDHYELSQKVYVDGSIKFVEREIGKGLALGESTAEIGARVRGLIRPDTPGGISYAARRLGRTEINNAYHGISRETYSESPFVIGVKWNLSRSHKKPDVCDLLEGEDSGMGPGVYPRTQIPIPPHPQCLCFLTPKTPEPDEFLDALFAGQYNDWLEENGEERIEPRPEAPKVAAAAPVKPRAERIGDKFDIRTTKQTKAEIEDALKVVDSVHGDGPLRTLPVMNLSGQNLGVYRREVRGPAVDIRIRSTGDHKAFTFVHELGHYLDHVGIRAPEGSDEYKARRRMVQVESGMNRHPETPMKAVWEAIQESPSYKEIQRRRHDPEHRWQSKYYAYLISPVELWARAYSQWIGTKAPDSLVGRGLRQAQEDYGKDASDRERGVTRYWSGQWEDEEFKPIGAAIEEMFRGMGWLNE